MAGDYETLIRATTSVGGHPGGPQVLASRRQGGVVLRLRTGPEFIEVFLNLQQCELLDGMRGWGLARM